MVRYQRHSKRGLAQGRAGRQFDGAFVAVSLARGPVLFVQGRAADKPLKPMHGGERVKFGLRLGATPPKTGRLRFIGWPASVLTGDLTLVILPFAFRPAVDNMTSSLDPILAGLLTIVRPAWPSAHHPRTRAMERMLIGITESLCALLFEPLLSSDIYRTSGMAR